MLINNEDVMGYLPINHILCVKCMQYVDTSNPLHICRKCAGDTEAKPASKDNLTKMACKALEPGFYHGVHYPENANVGLIRDLVRARLRVPKSQAKSIETFRQYASQILKEARIKSRHICI